MHIVEIILSFFISVGDGHVQVVTHPFVFDKESSCESVAQKLEPVYLSNMENTSNAGRLKVTHSCTVVKDVKVDVVDKNGGCIVCYRSAINSGFEELYKEAEKINQAIEPLKKEETLE